MSTNDKVTPPSVCTHRWTSEDGFRRCVSCGSESLNPSHGVDACGTGDGSAGSPSGMLGTSTAGITPCSSGRPSGTAIVAGSGDVERARAWIDQHMLMPERFRGEAAGELAKLLVEVRAERGPCSLLGCERMAEHCYVHSGQMVNARTEPEPSAIRSSDAVAAEPDSVHNEKGPNTSSEHSECPKCKGTGYVHCGDRHTGMSYPCTEFYKACPVWAATRAKEEHRHA